jgi:formaldehyde-activating enzyme involved in methanogenesis
MNIEQEANEIVFNYTQKQVADIAHEIADLKNDTHDTDFVVDLIINANSWVNFIAGDNDELYEKNRFHLAMDATGVTIFRGVEIDTDFRNGEIDETF